MAIKTNNLYEYFSAYPKEHVTLVLNKFKKEKYSIKVMIKRFGNDFKGTNAVSFLNYGDNFSLTGTLTRFEKLLKFVGKLEARGKTLSQIEAILADKDDVRLYKYVENVLSDNKEEINTIRFDLNKFLKEKGIDKKFLNDALYYHTNSDEKIAFKYKYGICVKPLETDTIATILKTNTQTVNNYIRNVIKNLNTIIDEYRKSLKEIEMPKLKEEKVTEIKIIGNTTKRKEFVNYFITNITTQEEKQEMISKIREVITLDKIKGLKCLKIAQNYFGPNLDQVYVGSFLEQSERLSLTTLIKTINKAIENPEQYKYKTKEPKQPKEKKPKEKKPKEITVKTLKSLIPKGEKTEEQIEEEYLYVKERLQDKKLKDTKLIKIMTKYFGEDLNGTYEGTYDRKERTQMYLAINGYIKKMHQPKKEEKQTIKEPKEKVKKEEKTKKEKRGKRKKLKTLRTLLESPNKTEEQINYEHEEILKILLSDEYQDTKVIEKLRKYFGEDLSQEHIGAITPEDGPSIRQTIRNLTNRVNNTKHKPITTKTESYEFIEELKYALNEEECNLVISNLRILVMHLKFKANSLYEELKPFFGDNLDQPTTEKLPGSTRAQIKSFMKHNKDKITNQDFYKINPFNSLPIDLASATNSSLPKEETIERIKVYFELRRSSMPKYINFIEELYDKNFINDSETRISSNKKTQFTAFLSDLNEFMSLSLEEYQTTLKTEFKSLIEEIKGDNEYTEEEILDVIGSQLLSNSEIKELLISIYGENYNKKSRLANLNKEYLPHIKYFIQRCKNKLINPERKTRTKGGTVIDLILGDISPEERTLKLEQLYLMLDAKDHDTKGYKTLDKLLRDNLPITSLKDQSEIINVRNYIKHLKDDLKEFNYIDYTDTDEVIVIAPPDTLDSLQSLSYLVFRFTKAYKKPEIVSTKLKVSIEQVLDIYLMYPDYLCLETLLQYVVYNHPIYIFKVLNLPYYKKLLSNLTHQEQDLLYLSMLKITNEEMSTKDILDITKLSKEEVKEYEIMTSNDEVNRLNLYLNSKKRNK